MSLRVSVDEIVAEDTSGLLGIHPTWERVRLREIAHLLNGFAFPSASFSKEQGTPLIRIRDVVRGWTETKFHGAYDPTYLVESGDLVVGMDGDFNCALWKGPQALLNQRVCKITPDERLYDKRFLSYALPGYLKAINDRTSSVTVKHLSSRTVQDIPLPLPTLPEQRCIVEAIETQLTRLDAAVAALKRAQVNLKRYRASVLKAAVEGRLVETEAELARREGRGFESGEELLEREVQFRADHNGAIPKGWSVAPLGRVASLKGGVTKGQKRKNHEVLREVPYLRVANVQRGYLDLNEMKMIAASEQEIADLRLQRGDILFNEGGDRDKLGRGWIWSNELPECIHQNHVFRARLLTDKIDPRFVSWFANSEGQTYFFSEGRQTTNLASLNMTKLSALPVPIPPADEGRRIVAEVEQRLSVVESQEKAIEASLVRAERMRQAVLKRAFEGRLIPEM